MILLVKKWRAYYVFKQEKDGVWTLSDLRGRGGGGEGRVAAETAAL